MNHIYIYIITFFIIRFFYIIFPVKYRCFTIFLYNFQQLGLRFSVLPFCCRPESKQTHTLLNHTTKGNKLLMCPLQAEACVFSGKYCQRWLVMSETVPRHGSFATLLCTTCQSSRLFPSSKVIKQPSPWWQEAGLGGAPMHDCAEPKNSPTIYRCSHGPFSWHLVLLTFAFLQQHHSLWHSREMTQGHSFHQNHSQVRTPTTSVGRLWYQNNRACIL